MKDTEFYHQTVLLALGKFQLLEFSLKTYIQFSYEIIQYRVRADIPFRYTESDIQNYSLGKLIDVFSKFSLDLELVKVLKNLVKERNDIAHNSFITGHKASKSGELFKATEKLMHVEEEVLDALSKVMIALVEIRAKRDSLVLKGRKSRASKTKKSEKTGV